MSERRGGTEGGVGLDYTVKDEGTQGIASPAGGVHVERPSRAEGTTGLEEIAVEDTRLAGGKTPEDILAATAGVSYPANKEDLIRAAAHNRADEQIVEALRLLPGKEYDSAERVLADYPRLPGEDDV